MWVCCGAWRYLCPQHSFLDLISASTYHLVCRYCRQAGGGAERGQLLGVLGTVNSPGDVAGARLWSLAVINIIIRYKTKL